VITDTDRRAAARYRDLLRAQPPFARLHQAARLTAAVRRLAEAEIRRGHPAASDPEIKVRLVARIYGRAVAVRLFGDLPADAV
jgi:hypothetical protein